MFTYRTFRNADPPAIKDLWNLCVATRGFGRLRGCDDLETYLFSKPYFDYAGFFMAFDDSELIGISHAGFGASEDENRVDRSVGSVCMVLVHPQYRRKGIGTELLHKAQDYLRENGSTKMYAGSLKPVNPFYLGLYGGSESPGVLESDEPAIEFLKKNHYSEADKCYVFNRDLDRLPDLGDDSRIPLLKRQVEITVEPWPLPRSYWHACTSGSVPSLRYEMVNKDTSTFIGHAWVWEMDTFGRAWGFATVGLNDFLITDSFRGQGYGKLLLHTILTHLKSQNINMVELQTMADNEAAIRLYEGMGFNTVDTGHFFQLDESDE